MIKLAFFCWVMVCLVAGCGKGNDAPANSEGTGPATNAASLATTAVAPKIALFSRLRESVSKTGDEVFSMADGQLLNLPKDLPGNGAEHDAYFAAKQIDGMIYYSEPGTLTWQMFAANDTEALGRKMDPDSWDTTLAGDARHLIESARDAGKFADGMSLEPGQRGVILFLTARGVLGMVRATNEPGTPTNVLRVESKIVELK